MAVAERTHKKSKSDLVYREELTPASVLDRSGDVHASRVAVVDGGREWTYREWRGRSRR